jgi:disulfide bond formation protein DsbB
VASTVFLLAPLITALALAARRDVLARPRRLLSTGLVALGLGLALMAVYWAWVSSQEPYDVSAACADALGESPEDRDFRLSLELETAFFPPSVTCAYGADDAELIEPRAVAVWTVVELAGLTLTSTGTVLGIAGVLRERRGSTGSTAAR